MESKDVAVNGVSRTSSGDEPQTKTYTIKDHWKCLAACTLVSMCPFQYGTPIKLTRFYFRIYSIEIDFHIG